jgi:4-oxalocrotonate tautomerase
MPIVKINMLEGRTKEKKQRLHKEVAETISKVLDVPVDRVTIQIVDIKKENLSYGGEQVE